MSFLDQIRLNEAQKEAVDTTEGPVLILAGAGTGKTTAITARAAHILSLGIPAHQILAVTFTNKAAGEMAERIESFVPGSTAQMWLGTFHNLCARLLRRHAELLGFTNRFTIVNSDDQLRLLKEITKSYQLNEKEFPPKYLSYQINRWKDRSLLPQHISKGDYARPEDACILEIYSKYQQRLKEMDMMDFGDLLLYALTLLKDHPELLKRYQEQFHYIIVDEYQDTNVVQYLWLRLLAQGHQNICCVGDDDQSIYRWRGAEVQNILRFEKDFPAAKIIKLQENYRSSSHILGAASELIRHNGHRHEKTLFTKGEEGEKITVTAFPDDRSEAATIAQNINGLSHQHGISLSHIAVLVRLGAQTRMFEEAFIAAGLPYRVLGGMRFYERAEIRDVIAYLRVIYGSQDDLSLERIINVPKRGIGNSTVLSLKSMAAREGISLFDACKSMLSESRLAAKASNSLSKLVEQFTSWHEKQKALNAFELTELVLEESGYLAMWEQDPSIEAAGRKENIAELVKAISEFDTLEAFLDHVSLISDIDSLDQNEMVPIMTLHTAKGLEFDAVFLPGWEEDLFPHAKALKEFNNEGLEEERRLAYVGVTRAKKYCAISYAQRRRIYGQYQESYPSTFINELPEAHTHFNMLNYYAAAPKQQSYQFSSPSPTTTQSRFSKNMRIFHQKFGYGRITAIDGEHLTIQFEKAGQKKIIDRFVEKA